MKKNKKTPRRSDIIKKEFSQIPTNDLHNIDMEIAKKVYSYQPSNVNEEISEFIQNKVIKKYVFIKSDKKIKHKCKKIASAYLENARLWGLQESWASVIAFLATIVNMLIRAIGIDVGNGDVCNFLLIFVSVSAFIVVLCKKRMFSEEAEKFLYAFNQNVPSLILVFQMIFYGAAIENNKPAVLIGIIIWFVLASFGLIFLWYSRHDECLKSENKV